MLWAVLMLQQWDMDAVVGPPSACQRHVDLKNLTCSNVAKQLKGFRLEHFFCSAPFPHSLLFTPSLSVPNSITTHTNTSTDTAEHPLSLFGAHEVPHLKYAFLPPGNARREKREPMLHMCVCGVGVENVFWQVSLMRSFYEICKPGNPTPSPPATPPSHLRLPLNQVWGLLLKLQLSRLHRHELSLWINGHIDGVSRVWECESRRTWKMKEDVINLQ